MDLGNFSFTAVGLMILSTVKGPINLGDNFLHLALRRMF